MLKRDPAAQENNPGKDPGLMRVKAPAFAAVPKQTVPLPIEEIQEAVENIHFGTVQLIIQNGRIVQIDCTTKKRLL